MKTFDTKRSDVVSQSKLAELQSTMDLSTRLFSKWLPILKTSYSLTASRDMMMKCRYRAGSVHVDVHFKRWDWVRSKSTRYIPARLYINEDCDLSDKNPNPEWFDEAE